MPHVYCGIDMSSVKFTEGEIEYYSRQIVLKEFGLEGQRKLKNARVCIVGLGGLGSPISTQLASMGVGHLRIIDRDIVEQSNLQRQHLYGVNQVGVPKVEAAEERIRRLNPFIEIEAVPMSVTPGNAETLLEGVDIVVDGLDAMTPRYAVNRACIKHGIPYVYGAVIQQIGSTSTIMPGETACLECFQGNVDDAALPSCATLGVHPSVINMVASVQVSETVRLILGLGPVLRNTLLFCDLNTLSLEKVKLAKLEDCPVCGSVPKGVPSKLPDVSVEEICGREGRRVFVFPTERDLKLDLEKVETSLRAKKYNIEVSARLGITFSQGAMKGSILSSGVVIIEGVSGREEAEKLRDMLIT